VGKMSWLVGRWAICPGMALSMALRSVVPLGFGHQVIASTGLEGSVLLVVSLEGE